MSRGHPNSIKQTADKSFAAIAAASAVVVVALTLARVESKLTT